MDLVDGSLTMFTRFEGWWCDNCREAWSRRGTGACPECGPGMLLVPATITVDVHRFDTSRD
jgi:hypothetical protein